jgi:hypothetical protein
MRRRIVTRRRGRRRDDATTPMTTTTRGTTTTIGALVDARARAMYDATYEGIRAAAADVPGRHRVVTTRDDDAEDDDDERIESSLVLVRVPRDVRLADVDGLVMTTTTTRGGRRDDAATTSEYRLGDFGRTIARAYDVADASDGDENNASLLTASSVGIARELTLTRRLEASDDGFEARGDDDENDASPSAAKEKKAKKEKKEKKEKKRESSTEKSAAKRARAAR